MSGQTLVAPTAYGAGSCGGTTIWSDCSATTDGSTVDISAEWTRPGQDGSGTTPSMPPVSRPEPGDIECLTDLCRPGYSVATLPEVTASDLVSFAPLRPAVAGEPAGLGVVGMPTNLVASARTHTLSGPLLGYDVTVRFTPVAFRFDHGDGTVRVAATGGASWASLGQASYSPTPTSHVYRASGAYAAAISIVYAAAVDFGTGRWRPVQGTVTSGATGYDVRIVEVRTALVDRSCDEDPRGPGC
jgi:hypothetical protein